MKTPALTTILAVGLALGACSNIEDEDVGTAAGAVIGGAAGETVLDSTAGTVGGAAAGAVLGREAADD